LGDPARKTGKYGIYNGDINQDGGIDILDMQIADNDATNFSFGYNSSDCNGDGGTDILACFPRFLIFFKKIL